MYLIKKPAEEVNAKELEMDDVISINKKWYVVRERLGLSDELKITGLRDNVNYTMKAVVGFGTVDSFRRIGFIMEDRWVEDLDIERKSIIKSMIGNKVTEDV